MPYFEILNQDEFVLRASDRLPLVNVGNQIKHTWYVITYILFLVKLTQMFLIFLWDYPNSHAAYWYAPFKKLM